MDPEVIPDWCRLQCVTYASDAMMMPGGWTEEPLWDAPYEQIPNTHPRLAGTHGTCLRIAREQGIPLMQILAASSKAAKYLDDTGLRAMQERGRIQEGMVSDITILDPEHVKDNATYTQGTLPTTGIPYVIVNDTVVIRDSVVLKAVNPGQPIHFPIEEAPRFEPLSVENWKNEYLVAPEASFNALDSFQPKQKPQTPVPAEIKAKSSASTIEQATKAGSEWFSTGAKIALSRELEAVFCPVHRVYEPVGGFTPDWVRNLPHNARTTELSAVSAQ